MDVNHTPKTDSYLMRLFREDMERRLFEAARAAIIPKVEGQIRQAAQDAVRSLEVQAASHFNQLANKLVVHLSINGAPADLAPGADDDRR